MAIAKNNRRLGMESLEDRRLMAGSIDLNGGMLEIDGSFGNDTAYEMTPESYRSKWGLSDDYPMLNHDADLDYKETSSRTEYVVNFLPKVKIEFVVADE